MAPIDLSRKTGNRVSAFAVQAALQRAGMGLFQARATCLQ
jgi:hypothetical protein